MGAVLFIAAIFPGTLRPMSFYALVRNGAAIVLSPAVGSWIDTGDRLNVVRVSIMGQRLAVAISCGIFWALHERKDLGVKLRTGLFAVTIVLACVEKLCFIMNLVSVERDWVVVITQDNEVPRRLLNARMRRIDLFCKLMGPLVISLVDGASTIVAIWVALGMSCSSVLVEYLPSQLFLKRFQPFVAQQPGTPKKASSFGQQRTSSTPFQFVKCCSTASNRLLPALYLSNQYHSTSTTRFPYLPYLSPSSTLRFSLSLAK
jgi:iron-regulated transporter 1